MIFRSLTGRILALITLILVVTAAALIYFTHRDVGRAMDAAQEAGVRNIFQLVELNIQSAYGQLLGDRVEMAKSSEAALRTRIGLAVSVLNVLDAFVKEGKLSQEEAWRNFSAWIRKASDDREVLLAFDGLGVITARPGRGVMGRSLEGVRDVKGRLLAQVMRYDVLDRKLRTGSLLSLLKKDVPEHRQGPVGDTAVFEWEDASGGRTKMLGCFAPFTPWKMTVAAVVDIGHMERMAEEKLEETIRTLKRSFQSLRIAQNGSVLLFSGSKKILIPATYPNGVDYVQLENPQTGRTLLDDMKSVVERGRGTLYYDVPAGEQKVPMVAYVGFFKALDWYVAVTIPVEEIRRPARVLVARQSWIALSIFGASLVGALVLLVRLSRPLRLLAAYAKEVPGHDFTQDVKESLPEESRLLESLWHRYRDEVGLLAESLLFMERELRSKIRELVVTSAAKERIESELNIAREIQMGMIPKIFPPFPEKPEFEMHAMLEPAKEVGGDLYTFFLLDDRHLCFAIGDVSTKGVPAALFMVITQTLIKTHADRDLSPAAILSGVNRALSTDNPKSMFVTLLVGMLDTQTGILRYANAGHNPPVILAESQEAYYHKAKCGLVAGAFPESRYKETTLTLAPRDSVFLYTDGVTEAMNRRHEMFSEERLLRELEGLKHEPVDHITKGIMKKIREFAADEPQSDDIAMLIIRYTGRGSNDRGA